MQSILNKNGRGWQFFYFKWSINNLPF